VRIYLGIALVVRGALFIADPAPILGFIRVSGDWFWPMAIAHYVALAHVGGGIFLTIGLVTRVAALVQIPPLVGAVFFVHFADGLLQPGQSLELAALVLLLLFTFAVFGAGRLSVEAMLGCQQRVGGLVATSSDVASASADRASRAGPADQPLGDSFG
jgi:uncharacterized membrane protein YphA (DoxX/SURF4 family)